MIKNAEQKRPRQKRRPEAVRLRILQSPGLTLAGGVLELFDGGAPARTYSMAENSTTGNTGNLSTVATDYIRGSDWGGGIGGILYSTPGPAGNPDTYPGTAQDFYHYDGRGDVVALTSNTGVVDYAAAYDAAKQGKQGVRLYLNTAIDLVGIGCLVGWLAGLDTADSTRTLPSCAACAPRFYSH